MSGTQPLKLYFGAELAQRLSDLIKPHYADFPVRSFVDSVAGLVGPLELKGRVAAIADGLKQALPDGYTESVAILMRILGPENETDEGMFTNGYFLMPVAYFVEKYGLDHFQLSMRALSEITKRHTAEYAIRPYLDVYLEESIGQLGSWSQDANFHVRRLVSEGTRPRLPWAKRIGTLRGDPACNLALLEPLLHDPAPYVRKSVANHLNDLTKDYKDVVLEWLRKHQAAGGDSYRWVVRHSLRSLVKSEDRDALRLLNEL